MIFTKTPLGRLQRAAERYLAATTAKTIKIVIVDKSGGALKGDTV